MMFGLELQASGNVFVNGVADREVAYRHESGLMTLEGDETTNSGASSELEFVTAPCASLSQAQQAVRHAADLAAELARQAAKAGPALTFKAGEQLFSAEPGSGTARSGSATRNSSRTRRARWGFRWSACGRSSRTCSTTSVMKARISWPT
jgi:hypothetical protein